MNRDDTTKKFMDRSCTLLKKVSRKTVKNREKLFLEQRRRFSLLSCFP
jgi:hypothetical protein